MYFFFTTSNRSDSVAFQQNIPPYKPPSSTYAEAKSKVGITRKNIKM